MLSVGARPGEGPEEPDDQLEATVAVELAEVHPVEGDDAVRPEHLPGEAQQPVVLVDAAGHLDAVPGHLAVEAADVSHEGRTPLGSSGRVAVDAVVGP